MIVVCLHSFAICFTKIEHPCTTIGSHDIDVCRWIAREDPEEVFAYATCFNPEIAALDDWDTVLLTLKFPSGRLASIDLRSGV